MNARTCSCGTAGHAMAAGFTVLNSNLDKLQRVLEEKADESFNGKRLAPRLLIDSEIEFDALNEALVDELEMLEPTGRENDKGAFLTRELGVLHCRRVGEDGRHLKLRVANRCGAQLDAIGFGLGEWATRMPRWIDAVYHVEMNEWQGRRRLQLRVLDIRAASNASEAVST